MYTNDLPRLLEAIERSLLVITAWDNDRLVGLVRVVGDGISITYIQDILVRKTHRRKGIGSNLIKLACEQFGPVRQNVLLADDTHETRGFYASLGFSSCDKGELIAFVRLT